MNWVMDVTVVPVPTDLCNGCLAHGGMWTSWLEVRDEIKESMIVTAGVHPSYKIVVNGHSLGAGLATFAATEFRNLGLTVDLVIFSMTLTIDQSHSSIGLFSLTTCWQPSFGSLYHGPKSNAWPELSFHSSQ